jgi:hypothetical protein
MKKLAIITLLFQIVMGNAQTKVIAHKSHSGNSNTFAKAYQNNLFDNFGMAPEPEVKRARLDSLIFVNDTCQIMVTTESCSNLYGKKAPTKEWNYQTQSYRQAIEVSKDKKTSVWKAGRDTVYNHYLFSYNESLDFVKDRIKNRFYFTNSVDSVIFVGYNNNKPYELSYPFIKINRHNYLNKTVYLNLIVNGVYLSDGTCKSNIRWGITYQKNDEEKWVTVLSVQDFARKCGLPYVKYLEETLSLDLLSYWQGYDNKITDIPKGKYKLFAENYNTKERIYSTEFTIK